MLNCCVVLESNSHKIDCSVVQGHCGIYIFSEGSLIDRFKLIAVGFLTFSDPKSPNI